MSSPTIKQPLEDDWENFCEFSLPSLIKTTEGNLNDLGNYNINMNYDNYNGIESCNRLEDLVHKLEEKVASCFKFSPSTCEKDKSSHFIKSCEFNDGLESDEIWKHITENYGLVQSLQWMTSHVRKLHISGLQLNSKAIEVDHTDNQPTESEVYELRRQLDFHRLIEYDDFPAFSTERQIDNVEILENAQMPTADEVIQELEEIMHGADEQDAAFDNELEDQTGIVIGDTADALTLDNDVAEECDAAKNGRKFESLSSQDESDRVTHLKSMSVAELNEELVGMERTVKLLSEDLLSQLNLRDELLYCKEIRNTFISKILEVQYKQEFFHQNQKAHSGRFKVGKLTKSFSMSSASASAAPGRYLTTVIPYEGEEVPKLQDLQVMIKLLDAIREDSDEVPSLITNYILKVLCPAPVSVQTLTL